MSEDPEGHPAVVPVRSQAAPSVVYADASGDLEIRQCVARMRLLVAAGFVMTLISACLALDVLDGFGNYDVSVGYAGVAAFGAATGWLIWILPAGRGPVVVVTPYGIRDLRIGNEFLPWDSIAEVSSEDRRGRRMLILTPTPALQQQLRRIHARSDDVKVDRIVIESAGLIGDFDTMLRVCRECHATGRCRTALQQEGERDGRGFALQAS